MVLAPQPPASGDATASGDVSEAHAALAAAGDAQSWAARFALLGDVNRLRMLLCIHRARGICVGDLAEALGMSGPAVSHALRLLRANGWVRAERDGRQVRYHLADPVVHELLHRVGASHAGLDAVAPGPVAADAR